MTARRQAFTFTENTARIKFGPHTKRFSQFAIGRLAPDNTTNEADFGGGTLELAFETLGGGTHVLRSISAAEFASMQDKTIRLELPANTNLLVSLTGATNPRLFVQHRNQDVEDQP